MNIYFDWFRYKPLKKKAMENISKHISYKEATFSATAIRYGIKNDPNSEELKAMKLIAEKVFEPIREHFGVPIAINSFFRCLPLNKKVGGSSSSQHVKGEAIDIDDTLGGVNNKQMFEWIKNNLKYTQLINEFNYTWVHIGYNPNNLKMQVLDAKKVGGKTVYVPH